MAYYRSTRRSPSTTMKPFWGFILVASFGILFAGCGGEPGEIPQAQDFTFTARDLERMKDMVADVPFNAGSGSEVPYLEVTGDSGTGTIPAVNLQDAAQYDSVRATGGAGDNMFRVTNTFLNVRSEPRVTAAQLAQLDQGEAVDVIEFVDAAWAKIRMPDGAEGFVSARYIGKPVSEEQLANERKKYEGLYFVDFGFLNIRKEADANSAKIGELPGQAFVRPLSKDNVWARVAFDGGEGYIAVQYLTPFSPSFLVRQDTFPLPVLHYRLSTAGVLDVMPRQVAALQQDGYTFWTFTQFRDLLLQQQQRDVRVPPKTVMLAVSDITPDNLTEVRDVLRASNVRATLFLQTQYLGSGIDNQAILNLVANGNDLQSGGHTGDDLRSLTNAQVDLELRQSRLLLEEATRKDVFAVGYPIGGVNERVAERAVAAGYLMGLTFADGVSFKRDSLLSMPGIQIRADLTAEALLERVRE